MNTFEVPDLVFADQGSSPILPFRQNRSFLEHRHWVTSFIQSLDGISSNGNDSIQTNRRDLIQLAQDYDVYLDSIVEGQWQRRKLEDHARNSLSDVIFPEIIDCSASYNLMQLIRTKLHL
jgi:hypothetical protein